MPRRLAVILISLHRRDRLCDPPDDCAWWLVARRAQRPGCGGTASTLDAGRPDAAVIAHLFWWMAVGSLRWCGWPRSASCCIACGHCAARRTPALATPLVVGGGVVLPTVLLAVLVGDAPAAASAAWSMRRPAPAATCASASPASSGGGGSATRTPPAASVELANELRLPRRRSARTSSCRSDNVIHAFWMPSLAGKVDMIPGRTTHLTLEPTRTGTFRGVCAEYCGTSHARMAFEVVVIAPDDSTRWLADAVAPRPPRRPVNRAARRARRSTSSGCGSCHAVRGTAAAGAIGPDLTHVGGRCSLAAGALPNGVDDLEAVAAAAGPRQAGRADAAVRARSATTGSARWRRTCASCDDAPPRRPASDVEPLSAAPAAVRGGAGGAAPAGLGDPDRLALLVGRQQHRRRHRGTSLSRCSSSSSAACWRC